MKNELLERLLSTLDIAIEAFAVCELRRGSRLILKPVNAIEVHYVLKGTAFLTVAGADPIVCGPGSLIVVPPGVHRGIAADAQPNQEVVAERHCLTIGEGLVLHDLAGGNPGDLRLVCGHVAASITGTLGLLDDLSHSIASEGSISLVLLGKLNANSPKHRRRDRRDPSLLIPQKYFSRGAMLQYHHLSTSIALP